jgi:orotidine-5'-phosphate decarboxylase
MNDPIIIALDVESADKARSLVRAIGGAASFYKVGLELYTAAGMLIVEELIGAGKQVFLDLKFYDIDETVKRATARVASTGVRFLTVHAVDPVMRAAAAGRAGSALRLLAVTVLTSLDNADLRDLGYQATVEELVERRARKAGEFGMDGLVCSPREVARVRSIAGPGAILVTPGVRSAEVEAGDQKRVATPAEAVRNGANYVVVGRQVTRAPDPRAAVERIRTELES